jgi:hypothetical protein
MRLFAPPSVIEQAEAVIRDRGTLARAGHGRSGTDGRGSGQEASVRSASTIQPGLSVRLGSRVPDPPMSSRRLCT